MCVFTHTPLSASPRVGIWRRLARATSGNNLTSLEGRILTSKPPMSPPIPALVGYGEPGKSGVGNPVDDDPQCVRAPRSLA
jgi:hypothetical protein